MIKEAIPDRMCTQHDLESAFVELGVRPGMILSVHSSLSSLGFVPGGARSVIDALINVLGPDGTLVMPAHCGGNGDPSCWRHPPVPESWWPAIREAMPAFDKQKSASWHMGAIAENFRSYPGVLRSDHPSNSFIACGPAAEELLAVHDLDCSLGDRSPNGALERRDAWVLLIGVTYDRCTEMHLAEYRSQCRTFYKEGASIMSDGQKAFVHYQEIELNSDDFMEPGRLLEANGLVRRGEVSRSGLRLFRVKDAVRVAESWLSENRLRKQSELDRERIMAYLRPEPEYNLFAIGDIENFGMSADFQDVMAYEKDGRIDSILLRYHNSYIPYSQTDDFALQPILCALRTPNLKFLSGKKSVLDRIKPHFPDFRWRNSYLMRLEKGDLHISGDDRPEPAGAVMKVADVADVPSLVDFLMGIAEFANQGTRDERIAHLTKAISAGSSRYYLFKENGKVIASAGTTAENSISAMVVAVATAPDRRNLGLASRLMSALCRDLLSSRPQYLCLFYDNPDAGRIYRRLGFKDAGEWTMAGPPDPIPKE